MPRRRRASALHNHGVARGVWLAGRGRLVSAGSASIVARNATLALAYRGAGVVAHQPITALLLDPQTVDRHDNIRGVDDDARLLSISLLRGPVSC